MGIREKQLCVKLLISRLASASSTRTETARGKKRKSEKENGGNSSNPVTTFCSNVSPRRQPLLLTRSPYVFLSSSNLALSTKPSLLSLFLVPPRLTRSSPIYEETPRAREIYGGPRKKFCSVYPFHGILSRYEISASFVQQMC